ncbi:sporulation histidine kinase inhibitor Sda [Bacillus taeanensis]|uniref:Sporulation histidine kinase inhibitor Sda n=1 Tax=Bacillus taeanensis TaxID=273032 RepID=A0A366XVZ3_9BACI|nr:sporulation histidine kinase inhibitor Sda [Bacillus taeanensis]RBW68111.1 sporulation histidine kinase inhibitor Sda [Bacillus taeanensis]
MKYISDELLLESYSKAIGLKLEKDFILLLEKEIQRRKVNEALAKVNTCLTAS